MTVPLLGFPEEGVLHPNHYRCRLGRGGAHIINVYRLDTNDVHSDRYYNKRFECSGLLQTIGVIHHITQTLEPAN